MPPKILSVSLVALLAALLRANSADVNLAWDASAGPGVSEYVVHYGASSGVYTSYKSSGLELVATISGLQKGSRYFFVVTARNLDGESPYSNEVDYTVPGVPTPIHHIYLEAESGVIASPMAIQLDPGTLGGQNIYSKTSEQGTASYLIVIPESDYYVVWARCYLPLGLGSDSYYVKVDNQAEEVYEASQGNWANRWQWTRVNGRAAGTSPRLFNLSQGAHTLVFRTLEADVVLDALHITNDLSFIPTDPIFPSRPINLQLTVEYR